MRKGVLIVGSPRKREIAGSAETDRIAGDCVENNHYATNLPAPSLERLAP